MPAFQEITIPISKCETHLSIDEPQPIYQNCIYVHGKVTFCLNNYADRDFFCHQPQRGYWADSMAELG